MENDIKNGGSNMLFVNEFVTYLIKFVALLVIAVVGVICGAKFKKNKLAKQADMDTQDVSVTTENE